MEFLKEAIKEFSDEHLLDQYFRHSDEYTPEALSVLREEVEKRNLDESRLKAPVKQDISDIPYSQAHYDTKDFVAFDHSFSHTDILLAVTILRDSGVVFFVDNPTSSDTIPLENEAQRRFTIHVHKDATEKAHATLDEHFVKNEGLYELKYTGVKDRLKAFSLNDLHLSRNEASEMLEVSLTKEETDAVTHYGRKLLDEVDKIESTQDRVVFYYDAIEPLLERLEAGDCEAMSRYDLLTILEILQIYCDDQSFPVTMDETIRTLLNLFTNA